MFRTLDDTIMVAGQVNPADIAEAAALGVTFVINNRPDEEQPGQPAGSEIEAAAKKAGLGYAAIPITHAGFSMNQVEAMRAALEAAPGKVLAFCRSGTRSTLVWALARATMGDAPDALAAKAEAAGYDLSPIRASLDTLAAQG
ncbi:TIGR01244 family sulfur transferase [Flavisphingomonas formosensis]|uniref:TIGR01244 family sulfur transferase n=1 Tax=Flavisphingomonas formosensis TaxID=861534 RepID=UPI0012FB28B6|nr:TIGR01244 family sulfur transferase [Sphingomonas formosensis]